MFVACGQDDAGDAAYSGEKYALVCYSGTFYAQKATDLLIEMGISADQIYTVADGIGAWEDGGDEYTKLLD